MDTPEALPSVIVDKVARLRLWRYKALKAWRARHPEESRIFDSAYKKMRRNPVFKECWPQIVAHYGGKCLMCGSSSVCADHVVALTTFNQSQVNMLSNLQPLCRSCNTKKSSGQDFRPDKGKWIIDTFPYARSEFKAKWRMACGFPSSLSRADQHRVVFVTRYAGVKGFAKPVD